jgi:hypothetical protein
VAAVSAQLSGAFVTDPANASSSAITPGEPAQLRKPAPAAAPKPLPAGLSVTATDGENLQIWLDREGDEPRRIEAESADLPPGRVQLQILRRRADGALRADLVRLTLQAGGQHLVAVGDRPLRARTEVAGRELDLTARFLPPGAVGVDEHEWRLTVKDPAVGPAPASELHLTFGAPRSEPEDLWLSAKDQVFLIVNPFAEAVACSVTAGDWQQEIVIDGPGCRFIPIGAAAELSVSTRLLPDHALIEERTLRLQPGLPLHTIGGATIYRWLGNQEGACPPSPEGALAFLSPETRVRLPAEGDPAHWLLVSQLKDVTTGLTVVLSEPPVLAAPPRPLTVQAGIQVVELEAPAALRGQPVSSVATDGRSLIAVVNGVACDYASSKPLHEPASHEIARAVAAPDGLVLLTRTGLLATVREGKLALGEPLYDPTWRLCAAAEPVPAVWLYGGGAGTDLILRPLDGSDSLQHLNSPGLTALHATGAGTLLVATGRRLDRVRIEAGFVSNEAILILPDDGPPIVSILDLDGRLIFATRDAVHALQGNLVLPLVEGLGGELNAWRDGLLVHDASTLRLYQLSGAALAPPALAKEVK